MCIVLGRVRIRVYFFFLLRDQCQFSFKAQSTLLKLRKILLHDTFLEVSRPVGNSGSQAEHCAAPPGFHLTEALAIPGTGGAVGRRRPTQPRQGLLHLQLPIQLVSCPFPGHPTWENWSVVVWLSRLYQESVLIISFAPDGLAGWSLLGCVTPRLLFVSDPAILPQMLFPRVLHPLTSIPT